MHNYKWWSVFSNAIVGLVFLMPIISMGAVNIDRTRVIFSSDEQQQSINLSNDSASPMLLQIWTDNGDPQVTPEQVSTPVIALPPFFKMLPGELRALRLLLTTRKDMPEDRESLLWLNIYQIAPMLNDGPSGQEKIILPLRLRLKVFIRPQGLSAPQTVDEEKLRFKITGSELEISNPTPWFMSLVTTVQGQAPIKNIMVSPYEKIRTPLTSPGQPGSTVHYSVITDNGNVREYSQNL